MQAERFWELIEAGRRGDEPLTDLGLALEALEEAELIAFDATFHRLLGEAFTADLRGAAWLVGADFLAFRAGLIASGRKVFEGAIEHADSLAAIDAELIADEMFALVAADVYSSRFASPMPLDSRPAAPETLGGAAWDPADLETCAALLPKMYAKYG